MIEAVHCGLQNGDLIQGTLYVTNTSPNEAFIESSVNKKSREIMILGLRDRNHAKEGDIVVAKVKDRSQWIVRESVYQAWINGTLDLTCDEDGLPLTIPPVKSKAPETEESKFMKRILDFLPASMHQQINIDKIDEPVLVNSDRQYDRETFIRMGIQLKLQALEQEKNTDNASPIEPLITSVELDNDVITRLASINISKLSDASGDTEIGNQQAGNSISFQHKPKRRITYRFLTDLDEDEWPIVPSICLQKTARVMFVAKPAFSENDNID